MREPDLTDLSLKAMRCVLAIADRGSLTAAARALSRTQPALTRALGNLERRLGVPLFDRHAHGMEATPHGVLFVARLREADTQLKLAGEAHRSARRPAAARGPNPVFSMEVGRRRLDAFLAVHELRDVGMAAERLGITRSAIYDSLRTLEDLLELPLFESGGAGLRSTGFGDVLASHLALAFSLIRHGLDEIASLDGELRGRLVIGTLPYSRTVLVPRSIHRVLQAHPQLRITTREGPYDVLERALRSGAIDLIVGATRHHGKESAVVAEDLFEDELAVICGSQHPLAGRAAVSVEEILRFGWVLPVRSTPARQLFDGFLARSGHGEPGQVIETGSMSMARGLLLESDRLALLSQHQVQLDLDAGLLASLPIRLERTFRPIGITRRAHSTPSPAARAFLDVLRSLAATHHPSRYHLSERIG